MNRKVSYLRFLVGFLVLLMAAPPWIFAQSSGAGATFRQEDLDQMLAPIALYPDSLLGQILVAATYPNQVTEADRWVNENKNLKGDELNAELDRMEWDLSVKALVPFPQVLSMMSDKMDWTQRMGEAFLAQQEDVMDSVQRLRGKAYAQGNLNSTEQQKVVVRGDSIEIVPANPRIVYVPAYNPMVIYGSWWYPSYPPYAYSPYYPGYLYDPYYTGAGFVTAGLFGFATGIAVGSIWNTGWGRWDWGRRNVNVTLNRSININRNDIRRGDIRTSSWHQVNSHRSLRSGTENVGMSGHNRNISGNAAMKTGTRPTSASVQKGLQMREGKTHVGQAKIAGQGNRAKVRSDSTKMGHSGFSGKSNAQLSGSKSSGKSNTKMGRSNSIGQSNAKMGHTSSSGKSSALMSGSKSFGKSNTKMGRSNSIGQSNAKMGHTSSSGKSSALMSGSKSSGKSNTKMGRSNSIGQSNAKMGHTSSSGKSSALMSGSKSSGKSNTKMGRSNSIGQSNAKMGHTSSSGKSSALMSGSKSSGKSNVKMGRSTSSGQSQGHSLRDAGSSSPVGKSNGAGHGGGGAAHGVGAAHAGGGSHAKNE